MWGPLEKAFRLQVDMSIQYLITPDKINTQYKHFFVGNINKKLCYCRKTTRRAMLVNSCYVSRGMGVRKVSNSKRDLQGHSRVLAMVSFDRPHTISYLCFIATISLSCTVNEILSLIFKNLKRSRDKSHIVSGVMYRACASHVTSSATAISPLQGQRCGIVCLNRFGNRASPSDNLNDRLKRLCLASKAAAPCG